jgi:hypothetical protein
MSCWPQVCAETTRILRCCRRCTDWVRRVAGWCMVPGGFIHRVRRGVFWMGAPHGPCGHTHKAAPPNSRHPPCLGLLVSRASARRGEDLALAGDIEGFFLITARDSTDVIEAAGSRHTSTTARSRSGGSRTDNPRLQRAQNRSRGFPPRRTYHAHVNVLAPTVVQSLNRLSELTGGPGT